MRGQAELGDIQTVVHIVRDVIEAGSCHCRDARDRLGFHGLCAHHIACLLCYLEQECHRTVIDAELILIEVGVSAGKKCIIGRLHACFPFVARCMHLLCRWQEGGAQSMEACMNSGRLTSHNSTRGREGTCLQTVATFSRTTFLSPSGLRMRIHSSMSPLSSIRQQAVEHLWRPEV